MRHLRVLRSAAVITLAALIIAPTAAAQQDTTEGATEINWARLGLDNHLQVFGANQTSDVSMPVPEGVTPAFITGQIGSATNLVSGRVDVFDGKGLLLGSIPIPTGPALQPFSVDTHAATLEDGKAKLSFAIHDDAPPTVNCAPPPSVTLNQLSTTYTGLTPNPRTIADFLPGFLDNVTIRVGANPSPDQQQAALSLVAKLTHMYRPIPLQINVDASPTPAAVASTSAGRTIEIRNSGRGTITVEDGGTPSATLVISGQGAELERQVELFADRRVALAQSPNATVTDAETKLPQAARMLTFGELGVAAQTTILGTTTLYAGFDSGMFGVGSIQEATIHLIAHYTPVQDATASVIVRSGSAVLASKTLDETGTVDLTVNVPSEVIASNVGLALELRYIPKRECTAPDKMTFALDPRSSVTVKPGIHNRGGFPALPMAFSPDFDVAIEKPSQLLYAAHVINLLGQQTTLSLRPNVTPLDVAAKSRNGLLAVADGDTLSKLGMHAPIQPGAANVTTIDGNPITEVDLGGPLAAIQAFWQDSRMVLAVTSSQDDDLIARTLDHIDSLDSRWATLNGDVVATGAAGTTVNLVIRDGGNSPPHAVPADSWKWWALTTLAVGVIVALALVYLVVRRRRRASR